MNYPEPEFRIVAHAVSTEENGDVTARLVLRDEYGFNVAVLAIGDALPDFDASVDSALMKMQSRLST